MNKKTIAIKTVAILSSFALLVPFVPANAVIYYVSAGDSYFSPQTITVPVGSTVTWTNSGNMPHTVTSDTGLFNSGSLSPGSTYSVSFGVAGTYHYYCSFHGGVGGSGMSGTVIVGGGGSTGNTLSGTVQSGPPLVVNQITPVKTTGSADGTYANGWEWVFDISAPQSETNLMMKFANWLNSGGSGTIPVASNMRFYSPQSSNAYNAGTAITITAANTYSSAMLLTGDLDASPNIRRLNITVQLKIPPGTTSGSYTTTYWIQTQ